VDLEEMEHGEEARRRARRLLGIDEAAPVLGTVASLTPQKDHQNLLLALARVKLVFPRVRLLLIGAGPLEGELRSLVDRLELRDHVLFLGARTDVAQILPSLDVFVLASRFEGLSIALLEAMASRVAPVATSVGGTPEALRDGIDGLLVEPDRPAQLAEVITRLLKDEALRTSLAAAAYDRVVERFSIRRAVEVTEDLYTSLLASPLS
jgi:glycosyltransferase involved in cell wall biosynthesis